MSLSADGELKPSIFSMKDPRASDRHHHLRKRPTRPRSQSSWHKNSIVGSMQGARSTSYSSPINRPWSDQASIAQGGSEPSGSRNRQDPYQGIHRGHSVGVELVCAVRPNFARGASLHPPHGGPRTLPKLTNSGRGTHAEWTAVRVTEFVGRGTHGARG